MKLKSFSLALLSLLSLTLATMPAQAITVLIKQAATTATIPFLLVDSSTGQTGQTGLASTAVVTVYKPGGSGFVAAGGTVTEIGNGDYAYTPTSTEDATPGIIYLHITCTGCQTVDTSGQVVGFDPTDGAALGLTTLTSANTQATNAAAQTTATNQQANNTTALTTQGFTTARASALDTTGTNAATAATNTATLKFGLMPTIGAVADGGSTTTVVDSNLSGSMDNVSGMTLVWLTGANQGKITHAYSYNTTNHQITVDAALANAPASGDTFAIEPWQRGLTNFAKNGLDTNGLPILSPTDTQAGTEDGNALLQTPANKLATNSSGQVVASSVAGNVTGSVASVTAPVTLPSTAPSGYGGGSAPTASAIAAAVWAYTIDPLGGGQNAQDMLSDIWDVSSGTTGTVTYPTGQQVTPYLRADGTTVAYTTTLSFNGSNKIVSRTRTSGTRP